MKQKIVISFDKDEHLPILIDFAHNLKEENIFSCDSELLVNMPNYNVIHKKILINENEMHIFLTNSARNFIRGFLYFKDKEYNIDQHKTYGSLQIGKFAYDNISVIRLSENPFQF